MLLTTNYEEFLAAEFLSCGSVHLKCCCCFTDLHRGMNPRTTELGFFLSPWVKSWRKTGIYIFCTRGVVQKYSVQVNTLLKDCLVVFADGRN